MDKALETKDINWNILNDNLSYGSKQWLLEQAKFIKMVMHGRLQYGFVYKEFIHLDKKIIAIDVPHSWRVLVNSVGPCNRWEFMCEIGGWLETDLEKKGIEITTRTANSLEEAIEIFTKNVTILTTGKDRALAYKK